METSPIVLDKGKESFDLDVLTWKFLKCVIYQKSGFLVPTENGRIRTIEVGKDTKWISLWEANVIISQCKPQISYE